MTASRRRRTKARCAHCGSRDLHVKKVTRSFGKGDRLLVIEAIPLMSCGNCGESYFTAATTHRIERVKARQSALAESRSVSVAQLG